MHEFAKRHRALWLLSGLILVALTAVLVLVVWTGGASSAMPLGRRTALLGISCLVILFVAYGLGQQRRLVRLEGFRRGSELGERTMRARFEELEALLDAGHDFGAGMDLDAVLDLVAGRVRGGLEADACLVSLLDEAAGWLEPRALVDAAGSGGAAPAIEPGHGVTGLVLASGQSLRMDAGPLLSQLAVEMNLERAPAAGLCVPLRHEGRARGVISVARFDPERPYREIHERTLGSFAATLAAAIERASKNGGRPASRGTTTARAA